MDDGWLAPLETASFVSLTGLGSLTGLEYVVSYSDIYVGFVCVSGL